MMIWVSHWNANFDIRRSPMATPIIMPRQGQSVESCIIAKWYKKKGDPVKAGDILFSYETDKAAFDEEAKLDGVVLEIFCGEGDDVPVLTNVCVIGNPGESFAEFGPTSIVAPSPDCKPNLTAVETGDRANTMEIASLPATPLPADALLGEHPIKISPRARNLAQKTGVDYRFSTPTGPGGRIIERDIQALLTNGPKSTYATKAASPKTNLPECGSGLGGRVTTGDLGRVCEFPGSRPNQSPSPLTGEYHEVKLSNIRKMIARTMHDSLATSAQLTLNASFNAGEILAYRKKLKENKYQPDLTNITINDIILYAVSRVLLSHWALNAHLYDEKILFFNQVNLGVAVDTERGLMVPTIFAANTLSLEEISKGVKKLAEECQKGSISPDLLQGGTFTVTNLGTLGIESFTPVLNPPQTGILGVNTIVYQPQESKGVISLYPSIGLSLTFDHRALDGAPAARFLQELKNYLENFSILLAR